MAEKGKNGNRNYRKEYDTYHGTPEQRAKNNQRKAARRAYEKAHGDLPANVDIDTRNSSKTAAPTTRATSGPCRKASTPDGARGERGTNDRRPRP